MAGNPSHMGEKLVQLGVEPGDEINNLESSIFIMFFNFREAPFEIIDQSRVSNAFNPISRLLLQFKAGLK